MEIENGKDDSEQIEVYNIELLRINVQEIPWWFSGLDSIFTAKGLDSTPGLAEKLRTRKLQAWRKKKKKEELTSKYRHTSFYCTSQLYFL